MNIIGLTAHHGASSAALLQNGCLIAAFREERLTRVPWDRRLPINASRNCLDIGKLANPSAIDAIAFYRDPMKKKIRQIRTGYDPKAEDTLEALDPQRITHEIKRFLGYDGPVYFFDYLETFISASSAQNGSVLSLCTIGDDGSMAWGEVTESGIVWTGRRPFPHSPDMFLNMIGQYLGFDPMREERNVFALGFTGEPRYLKEMRHIHKSTTLVHYEIDLQFGCFSHSKVLYSQALIDLLGCPPRTPTDPIETKHRDIAASALALYETILLEAIAFMATDAKRPSNHLTISSSLGEFILERHSNLPFKTFTFSSPSDESHAAIGAAILAGGVLEPDRKVVIPSSLSLSLTPSRIVVDRTMRVSGIPMTRFEDDREGLVTAVVDRLVLHKSLALFQGPDRPDTVDRGARCILFNPMHPEVLASAKAQGLKASAERGATIYALSSFAHESRGLNSSRLWTKNIYPDALRNSGLQNCAYIEVKIIRDDDDALLCSILKAYRDKSGHGFLLAFPFSVGAEPVVTGPEEAIRSMVKSQIDALVFEDYLLDKASIPLSLRKPTTGDPMERGGSGLNHPLLIKRPERIRQAEGTLPRGINLFF